MTKFAESDLLQIKQNTKDEIIFNKKMVKTKHLLKGVKTKLSYKGLNRHLRKGSLFQLTAEQIKKS